MKNNLKDKTVLVTRNNETFRAKVTYSRSLYANTGYEHWIQAPGRKFPIVVDNKNRVVYPKDCTFKVIG